MQVNKQGILEEAKKDGKVVIVDGSGLIGKKLIDAMMQSDLNMKKTGTIKL